MRQVGISHPGVIDLVTRGDDAYRLIVVEERALAEDDAPALQEKLNNYLSYAVDGQFARQYPESRGRPVCIRIDLYAEPADSILEFVRAYRAAVAPHGVKLELSVDGELRE